ncbi:Rpn family recombination-promoting nuclease/putative transposase [Clostridium ihumii]|uniref:Rpn family recombination-promoting nuclease/putative transposase n=1 Tax=Clostridium ihumii TaxID=1470356 RepID=UPI003D336099
MYSYISDKKSILDIRAESSIGTKINIEIQVLRTLHMPERSLYYWSKMYIEQLNIGEKYSKLKKTITINVLDFDLIQSNKYHTMFKLKENEENTLLTDVLEVHFLELQKVNTINDKLAEWLTFIKADSMEEMKNMAEINRDIDKAYDILTTMSYDEKTRREYLAREMVLHDEATRLEEAIEEGRELGLKQGIEQGVKNGLRNARIEDILDNLSELGTVPSTIKDILSKQTDIKILKNWVKLSLKANSISDFLDKIK